MSNLDCFNLCEESCLKCKTRKADSKYCRYCDVCNKECPILTMRWLILI